MKNKENQSFRKNENQFLEKSKNNELNSKTLYIHCIHIVWSWIKRKKSTNDKDFNPQKWVHFFVCSIKSLTPNNDRWKDQNTTHNQTFYVEITKSKKCMRNLWIFRQLTEITKLKRMVNILLAINMRYERNEGTVTY